MTPSSANAKDVAANVVEALVVDAETGKEPLFASVTVVRDRNYHIVQEYHQNDEAQGRDAFVEFNFSINMNEANNFTEMQSVYVDTYHHID